MATTKNIEAEVVAQALDSFNADNGKSWTFGTNWDGKGSTFETFVNNYLFPKLNETTVIDQVLGNRFNDLAEETDFIGQYSEEYVVLDSVPIEMDLSKNTELMLKRNYPKIASKLYGAGILKKVKFTLNNNDVRFNFRTIGDATKYALAVYNKKISDINVAEEKEIKAMLMDYAINVAKDKRRDQGATDMSMLLQDLNEAILNLQNNSDKHNEASTASGGSVASYTTVSKLEDLLIVTTDKVKARLLDSMIAQTYNAQGIDLTGHIISFDDLGGAFKVTSDITLTAEDVTAMQAYGNYQAAVNDVIPKGTILLHKIGSTNNSKLTEIKPVADLFAMVIDKRAIRYKRYTKGMLKEPFYNGEFDEVTYWIHYYSFKAISPFFNKIVIGKAKA